MSLAAPTCEDAFDEVREAPLMFDSEQTPALEFAEEHAGRLLAPLEVIAQSSRHLTIGSAGTFSDRAQHFRITRFTFTGPSGGGDPIRLGVFAALRGDDVECAAALVEFVRAIESDPTVAEGFQLHVYPICNPSGFEDGTPQSRAGRNLISEFGCSSYEPAVYYLEREIESLDFHGVVTLLGDAQASSLRIRTRSAVLAKSVAEPAMLAGAQHLPVVASPPPILKNNSGFLLMREDSILTRLFELRPSPFELILESPRRVAQSAQIQAIVAALKAILHSYRELQAVRANI